MCGIAGFIDRTVRDPEGVCGAMTAAIVHRGPDDSGCWFAPEVGLAMGFRRLSIVDLSAAGHQPMASASGRYVLTFNGEIYNHAQLRAELEALNAAPAWRGHSDTEVLLAAVERWGLRGALVRAVGMFAIALWDREQRRLSLARDRAGEKPLYYGRAGPAFLYGSELKALRAHPHFRAHIDRGALALYLRYNYVPDPLSIYQGIERVPPGTIVEVDELGRHAAAQAVWTLASAADPANHPAFDGDDAAAVDTLERVLGEAVGLQMVADVPLGAFLSGGIDSSLIVALMQRRATQPVRTFTIGFTEPDYDESPHARAVARHLGTQHTELLVTPAEAMAVIPRLPAMYDEPFGDSSQIPTHLVAQLARQHVTVSLSGDAGDELFGGYNRYTWAGRLSRVRRLLGPARHLAVRSIRVAPPARWTQLLSGGRRFLPRGLWQAQAGDKLHRAADLLAGSTSDMYRSLVSHWPAPAQLVLNGYEPPTPLTELMSRPTGRGFQESMMYWDFHTYLLGDILVKVDRAAMAVSLETRIPMLDHRVIEFAWSLPLRMRLRNGSGKWLLKALLSRYVPSALTERPKSGFAVPIDTWLRGPLREWAETLLAESRLREEGFFDPVPIRQKWLDHLSGRRNWAHWLWDVLMFQSWHEEQVRGQRAIELKQSQVVPLGAQRRLMDVD